MKFIEGPKGQDPIAVINEFDLHNLLCAGVQLLLSECIVEDDQVTKDILDDYGPGCSGCVSGIKIVPMHPDKFEQCYINRWEPLIAGLFSQIRMMDGQIHEDAEYTC